MSRATYNHPHIYRAISPSLKMYRCIIENCPHSLNAVTMVGREAKCGVCGSKLTITEDHLRRRNINCIGCGRLTGAKTYEKSNENKPLDIKGLIDKVKSGITSS